MLELLLWGQCNISFLHFISLVTYPQSFIIFTFTLHFLHSLPTDGAATAVHHSYNSIKNPGAKTYSTSSSLCIHKEDALEILGIFSIRFRCVPCQDANLGLLDFIVFSCFCQNSQHWGYKMMDEIPVKWSHHKQNLGFVPIMIRMETQKVCVTFLWWLHTYVIFYVWETYET